MAKVELISKSAFAVMMGVSPAAVTKAIAENRITTVRDGDKDKIDPAVAQIQWAQNTRARSPSSNAAPAADATTPATTKGNNESGYWDSRTSREEAEAGMAQLKLAELRKSLIPVDAVRAAFGTAFSSAREALMQIPSRIAPALAAESDPQKIQITLGDAIHAALMSLSKAPESLPDVDATA